MPPNSMILNLIENCKYISKNEVEFFNKVVKTRISFSRGIQFIKFSRNLRKAANEDRVYFENRGTT